MLFRSETERYFTSHLWVVHADDLTSAIRRRPCGKKVASDVIDLLEVITGNITHGIGLPSATPLDFLLTLFLNVIDKVAELQLVRVSYRVPYSRNISRTQRLADVRQRSYKQLP